MRTFRSFHPLVAALIVAIAPIAALASPAGYDRDIAPTTDATPTGLSYMLTDHWGGVYHDAEKSPVNSDDDLMCWAATAANVLAWTGWGRVDDGTGQVMTTADEMFAYFQDHWTDVGGLMYYGWDWWFDGTNDMQGVSGWSQVNVPGGGFYPQEDPDDHIATSDTDPAAMASIDALLHAGAGVGAAIYRPKPGGGLYGHSLTVWGYNYADDAPNHYLGVWVSDSDDDKSFVDADDRLRYYEVDKVGDQWRLQGYSGRNDWYIGAVEGVVIPEPATLGLLLAGAAAGFGGRRRRGRRGDATVG